MASIITIHVKGVSKPELDKNFQIVDSFMNQQPIFTLVTNTKPNFNPRIYYSETTVIPKTIHDIIHILKTDKNINQAVKGIAYSGNLNKM